MALPFGAHVPFSSLTNNSPLSFGFGFGIPQHHLPPPPPPITPTSDENQTPISNSKRPNATPTRTSNKRKLENEDVEDDAAMMEGRSPSPFSTPGGERPMRRLAGGGKKMRMTALSMKLEEEDAVDVGSLLASLPPSSLLPLLTSLIHERPELKPIVLSLIPRPTLEIAIQAVLEAAKKLRDAYPYSQGNSSSSSGTIPVMRDSYIRTRLRGPVREFTKLLLSYMSYFSSSPTRIPETPGASSNSATQKPQPTVPLHPTESFTFLHTITTTILRFPPLTLAEFARPSENIVFPRLQSEWESWVSKLDDDVNRRGGMYRSEDVQTWERGLDEMVSIEENLPAIEGIDARQGLMSTRSIRDRWIERVGWLVGRRTGSMGMEM